MNTTLRIDLNSPIGTISPRLYGQFAEHLGRCCYDGVWAGQQSDVPHQDGLRLDVLRALQQMPVPLLRWPGGCYADHYHWQDGIGPADQRPRRLGMSCGITVEDDNSFGTHEFLQLCSLLGAEPYLAGNVGTGTPQELSDWLEYCNSPYDTTLTRLRRANGAAEPFGVRLWGVGNENWGCGGNYDAATYTREYRRYATMLRHVDPTAELVVCGFEDDWNVEVFRTLDKHVRLVDHLSIHRYWIKGGAELDFTEQEYYTLLDEADETEDFVKRTADIIASETDGSHHIGIALDEWGVWHPEARPWGPGEVERRNLACGYEQAGTVRDAVAAAIALEGFHRQCNHLSMANLAQIVNVLHAPVMTQGAAMWLTPTYYVFQLHKPHIGATALPIHVEQGLSLTPRSPHVSATASRTDNRVAVTLTNRHYSESTEVRLPIGSTIGSPIGQLLESASPRDTNSAEYPDRITLQSLPVAVDGDNSIIVKLPPHSVATVQFTI